MLGCKVDVDVLVDIVGRCDVDVVVLGTVDDIRGEKVDGLVLDGALGLTLAGPGLLKELDSMDRQEAEMFSCGGLRESPRIAEAEMLQTISRLLTRGAGPTSGAIPMAAAA